MKKNAISVERQMLFYVGRGMTIVGIILFLSTFFSFMNPASLSMGSFMARPVIGIILIASGQFVSQIGARGAAGSGMILNPDQAQEDLKPWTTMAGGMLNDAVSQVDGLKPPPPKEVIRIKCRSCKTLNEEDATYCKKCGETL